MEAIPFDMYATGVVDLQAAASTQVGEGRFTLRRILGRGGMGIVWLAYDERLQCEVALKFLPPQIKFDPVAVDDLRRETARSQKLTHPNIIRIHDLYEPEGQDAFISMEYVDGSNLGTLRVQQAERVLTWSYLEPLVRQLCDALEYAHSEGIIHRDLKPANLMVDQSGKLKLTDFGIARAVTDTMSRSSVGQTSGTLLYMSPQQLDGGLPRVADDIYGMGATLYELLTSKPPFYTGDLLNQVRNVVAKPLRERLRELKLTNDIPRHVEDVIIACLSKVESQRPQQVREAAEWLSSGQRPSNVKRRRGTVGGALDRVRGRSGWYGGAAALVIAVAAVWMIHGRTKDRVAGRGIAQPLAARDAVSPILAASPQPSAAESADSPAVQARAENPVETTVKPATDATVESQAQKKPDPGTAIVSERIPPPTPPPTPSPPSGRTTGTTSEPAAAKQPTALQLLRQGNTHVTERSKNKVLQMRSSRASVDLPPQQWQILYFDPKARYKSVEVQFEDGKMTRVYEPTRLLGFLSSQAQKPLDAEKLKIDSPEALRIALALPAVKDLIIRTVALELERGYGGAAVWKVHLFGAGSSEPSRDTGLGYAIILADDGRVLKETLTKK